MDEFSLIATYFTRRPRRAEVVLGIGDDAALLRGVTPGYATALTTDTLVAGGHFAAGAPGFDVGYKALAVNISDLAAMGARPIACLLNLTVPALDEAWLASFRDGLFALADAMAIDVIGGDTVRGPLSVTITAIGEVAVDEALRRGGARVGDHVYVTGFLGEAALGFLLRQGDVLIPDEFAPSVLGRLDRPLPRIAEGQALRSIASAGIDVSDGLVADLGHLLRASGLGAQVDLRRLPLSPAYRAVFSEIGYDPALGFGDDYELCFTVPPGRVEALRCIGPQFSCGFHHVGDVVADPGLIFYDGNGPYVPSMGGFNHFRG